MKRIAARVADAIVGSRFSLRLHRHLPSFAFGDQHVVAAADRLGAAGDAAAAEHLLAAWVAIRPDSRVLRLRHAFGPHHAGLYEEAVCRWDALRARWPDTAIAWCGSAANRRELGRAHEARAIIDEARTLFPDDLVTITEAIRIHDALDDGDESLRLSAEMIRLDPACAAWRQRHCDRLMAAGRLDAAAALIDEAETVDGGWTWRAALLALRRGDGDRARALLDAPGIPAVAAAIATAAKELQSRHPADSLLLFELLDRIEPGRAAHQRGIVGSLVALGALPRASAVLTRALVHHPADAALLKLGVRIAIRTERFADALADLRRLRSDGAHDAEIDELSDQATEGTLLAREASAGRAPRPSSAPMLRQEVGHVVDEAAKRLLLGFESLGQDCEFGLLQRRFGAEPLGLFRWNFCETAQLAAALDDDLKGVGEAEHSALLLANDQEYYLQDLRYGFTVHSWQTRTEIAEEVLFAKMCTRVGLLRRKLLEDLGSGDKIFVHKTFATATDDVVALAGALRRHRPNTLLWVRSTEHPADGPAPQPGTVETIAPGLLSARLSRFGNRVGVPWQIAHEEWLALCAKASALVGQPDALSA